MFLKRESKVVRTVHSVIHGQYKPETHNTNVRLEHNTNSNLNLIVNCENNISNLTETVSCPKLVLMPYAPYVVLIPSLLLPNPLWILNKVYNLTLNLILFYTKRSFCIYTAKLSHKTCFPQNDNYEDFVIHNSIPILVINKIN